MTTQVPPDSKLTDIEKHYVEQVEVERANLYSGIQKKYGNKVTNDTILHEMVAYIAELRVRVEILTWGIRGNAATKETDN